MMTFNKKSLLLLIFIWNVLIQNATLLHASDSTDSELTSQTFSPNSIFVLKTGTLNVYNTPSLLPFTAPMLKILFPGNGVVCPPNFSPYIVLGSNIHGTSSSANVIGATNAAGPSGACVFNIKANTSSSYKVGMLIVDNTTLITYNSTTLTVNDPGWYTVGFNISWTLYCYPSSMSLSVPQQSYIDYSGICNPSTSPYNSAYQDGLVTGTENWLYWRENY